MKRTLLFSVQYAFPVIMLFICECVSAQYDQLFPPVYSTTSSPISYDILIDGVEESYYSLPEKMEHFAYGKETGESDLSAEFNTVWNDEYLALFVKVNDDTAHCISPEYWDSTGSFDYIDLYTNNTWNDNDSGGYADDAIHLRWCRGSDTAFFPSANWYSKAAALGLESFEMNYRMIEDGSSGYILEAAIPWEAIFYKGENLGFLTYYSFFGLEVSVGDSDDEGELPGETDHVLYWDDDSEGLENAWFDTRAFGILELNWDTGIKEISKTLSIDFSVTGKEVTFNDITSIYNLQGILIGEGTSFHLEEGIYIARSENSISKFIIP
jgi:hypothetical protein